MKIKHRPCRVVVVKLQLFLDKSVAVQDALESRKSSTVGRSHCRHFAVLLHTYQSHNGIISSDKRLSNCLSWFG